MIQFTVERVLLMHQMMMQATGGSDGLRDISLVESAVNNAKATFAGQELYPSKEEKAAVLCYSLINNHAFIDGNKRIGIYVLLTFLDVNGVELEYSDDDAIRLGMEIAQGKHTKESVLEWINTHRANK